MAWFDRGMSLRARITAFFTVIVIGGTVVSTLIGSRIITSALLNQAQNRARQGLDAARMIYAERLGDVRVAVARAAIASAVQDAASAAGPADGIRAAIAVLPKQAALDFLAFVDVNGRMFPASPANTASHPSTLPVVVTRAMGAEASAGTEIMSRELLRALDPALADRALIVIVPPAVAEGAPTRDVGARPDGLALVAAAPVQHDGKTIGAVLGGVLLSRNNDIVDRVKRLVYGAEMHEGRDVGTVTVFLRDIRIATNVMTTDGQRAIGTLMSAPVAQAVVEGGQPWNGRAFVVNDWYLASYEPIRDPTGSVVGVLYSGILERPFLAARTEVMVTFLGVCFVGLVVVFALTYVLTRTTIRPLEEMAAVASQIAAGHRDVRARTGAGDEVGVLASSFNNMLDALQTTERELEEWARTLEVKVQERSDELVSVQARMAQSEKLASIGRLAAGVAHGINNPLGGILALSMLALEDCGPDHPMRADLETIVKQTMRCHEIVKGLLDFSRQNEPRASKLDVNLIIDSTLALLERQALFHNIKTIRHFQNDLPPVFVDPGQLQEIVINIVLNAVDAMDEKGELTVETGVGHERKHIVIRITDTGKGIPQDVLPLIFEPFFTTKKVGQGTGLGLAIVHGLVTRAGGDVHVASKPGQTTFTVWLPVAPEGVEDATAENAGGGAGQSAGRS